MAWTWIGVGSNSPPKLAAARAVFAVLAPGARVLPQRVPSGVPAQPQGSEETQRGARLRAERALAAAGGADLGVGMEGGVLWEAGCAWTVNWCAVAGPGGRLGLGRGVDLLLPPALAERVAAGAELGQAIDELTGRSHVARAEGTVGVLTGGILDRASMWRGALAAAMAPFLHSELYS